MIDFNLTEEQRAIQKVAQDFAKKEIKPIAAELDRIQDPEKAVGRDIIEKGLKVGFNTILVQERYGGGGGGVMDFALMLEELSVADAGIAESFCVSAGVAKTIDLFGTEEQRERWLPIASHGMITFGATEPSSGSDLWSRIFDPEIVSKMGPRSTCKLEGDAYIINGTKCFTTNGGIAKLYGVLVRNDLTKPLADGASIFFISPDTPGFSLGKMEDKLGQRLMSNADLIMDNVRLPKENLLGYEGFGGLMVADVLSITGAGTGAIGVGISRAAFDAAFEYAKTRETWGRPIVQHQAVTIMLADMMIQIEAARNLVYKAGWHYDNHDRPDISLANMAKVFAADTAMKVTIDAVQILGGYGYMRDYPVEKYMRDAKLLQIYDGSNQILRLEIMEEA